MKEILTNLLALQDVDNEIDLLHKHKSDYPTRMEELKGIVGELTDERTANEERAAELEQSVRHFQQQLEISKDDLVKHQERLLQIKTNKEFDAVQQEILSLQQSSDDYEMELLKADEEAATVRQALEETEAEHSQKVKEGQDEIADLAKKTKAIDTEVEEVIVRRKAAAEGLDARMLNMYERVRRGRKLAVARVLRGACSGCWRAQPPQRINELRKFARVIVCEGCGRILVWGEDDQS